MLSTTQVKNQFVKFFGSNKEIAKHPPKNMLDGSMMFSKEITIEIISTSNDLESELYGLRPGLLGKAKGWFRTPSRWLLLVEWPRKGRIFEVALIYGFDTWKVID